MRSLRTLAIASAIFLLTFLSRPLLASDSAPAEQLRSKKIIFSYLLPSGGITDGTHSFRVRLFDGLGALVHDETLSGMVTSGVSAIILGSVSPLVLDAQQNYRIAVSVDGGREHSVKDNLAHYPTIRNEKSLSEAMESERNKLLPALNFSTITSQYAENVALSHNQLSAIPHRSIPEFTPFISPLTGINFEVALASPNTPTLNTLEMAKYGRLNLEINNIADVDGNNIGLALQAMHVAHHLLLYAGGFTSDINNDGMFLMTMGLAHYQTGNSRSEPFVDAPFIRMKFHSSQDEIFGYSEIETTMHYRAYLSGTVGIGLRLNDRMEIIGGYHHTEFVMPTEQLVRMVDGFNGILSFGM